MSKKFYIFDSDALKNFHKRILFSITIFIFVYIIVFYRILDIMILNKSVNLVQKNSAIIERGKIYDRNGYLLSGTIESNSVYAIPKNLKNKDILSEELSLIFGKTKKEIFNKLISDRKKIRIKRNITPKQHQQIINLGQIGLVVESERKRIFPYKNTTSHVVGYTDVDGIGLSGIERGMNSELQKGKDIYLSLDINLQSSVRNELIKIVEKFSSDSGTTLVMDVTTGEIISLVSLPDFDPNNNKTFNTENLFNRALQGNYEMGSIFKPITFAIGIDKNIITPDMIFDVSKPIKGIKDFHPINGSLGIKECIVKSSNICAAKIAKKIGKKNQINFFQDIGLDKKINAEIKEIALPLGNKNNWGEIETMTIGFGHGFATTPLNLISSYVTLVNKGYKIQPTFLKNQRNQNNIKIIKEQTSSYILKLLRAVILETEFTGPRVKIKGYEIGGKTGTAELIDKYGQYKKNANLTSFIGVFPVSDPKYVVLAIIENPKKIKEENYSITGATVAAPLVKKIILRMIEILDIPPLKPKEILKVDTSINYHFLNNASF